MFDVVAGCDGDHVRNGFGVPRQRNLLPVLWAMLQLRSAGLLHASAR